jgi:hypothetical protein
MRPGIPFNGERARLPREALNRRSLKRGHSAVDIERACYRYDAALAV